LAASLTRRPAAISRRALSTFAFAIGGRPNLMLASRAAACPRRIRSRQFWRRWAASMALIADSGHRDQPIRLIVITQTGDRDHAAHLGRGVPGVQHGVALVVTTDGCSVSLLAGVRQ